ncbi:alpha/beta hydrolase [Cerasicoccus fimbriatus]|uniref:alpha/beta hydrolase n=1 Tax=Cerasicoccus fimbriatus TaxID=3014554 RepID=UPI0022B55EC2|nr:alpha/beta hydrolase [Cerasicoccus sp. TK19100]
MPIPRIIAFFALMLISAHAANAQDWLDIVEYKTIADGKNLELHICYPQGHTPDDKSPAVIFFFGGGWRGGKPGQFYPYIIDLAKQGVVGISAEYRTKSSHGVSPVECVKDAKSAVRYVREHAAEMGIDPNRIIAAGGSAGGHVAACTAISDAPEESGENLAISSRPEALILINPVISTGPEGYAHGYVTASIADWQSISPLHRVDGMPPTLLQTGEDDTTTPLPLQVQFQEQMETAGQRCDLVIYQGAGHGFFNKPEFQPEAKEQINTFLRSLGYMN